MTKKASAKPGDLPSGVVLFHGAYRYRGRSTGYRWLRLCAASDGEPAMREAYEQVSSADGLVKNSFSYWAQGFKGNLKETDGIKASSRWGKYSEQTRNEYTRMLAHLCEAFRDFRGIRQIGPQEIIEVRNEWADKPRTANQYRALISLVFGFACEHSKKSGVKQNPVRDVARLETPKRTRYMTHDEYLAIREALLWAPPQRGFSAEVKRKAVALLATLSHAEVARRLDLNAAHIRYWESTVKKGKPLRDTPPGKHPRRVPTGPLMQRAWDIAYVTLQRMCDVFNLNPTRDIVDDGENKVLWAHKLGANIRFLPSKTKDSSGESVLVEITPEINALLDQAHAVSRGDRELLPCGKTSRRVVIPNPHLLFHDAKGQAYDHHEIGHIVRRACARVGIDGLSFWDLRPKASTDATRKQKVSIEQLQVALAHTNIKTTQGYVRKIGAGKSAVVLPLPKKRMS